MRFVLPSSTRNHKLVHEHTVCMLQEDSSENDEVLKFTLVFPCGKIFVQLQTCTLFHKLSTFFLIFHHVRLTAIRGWACGAVLRKRTAFCFADRCRERQYCNSESSESWCEPNRSVFIAIHSKFSLAHCKAARVPRISAYLVEPGPIHTNPFSFES